MNDDWISAAEAPAFLVRQGRSVANARAIIIGAAQAGDLSATGTVWENARFPDEMVDGTRGDEVIIDQQFWLQAHAEHFDLNTGHVPMWSCGDWEISRFRSIQSLTFGTLPARWEPISEMGPASEKIELESEALDVAFDRRGLERLKTQSDADRYVQSLKRGARMRPGPAPREEIEAAKTALILAALDEPDRVRAALEFTSAKPLGDLPALFREYAPQADDAEIYRFCRLLQAAWQSRSPNPAAPTD